MLSYYQRTNTEILIPAYEMIKKHETFLITRTVGYAIRTISQQTGSGFRSDTYIHTYFISNTAVQCRPKKVTRTTLYWEDGKATTAITAALKKRKKLDGHGRARREAARRRKSECKINFRKTKFLSQ